MSYLKKTKGPRLGIKEWYVKRMVSGMSKEEKQSMMEKMMDEFFASMTSEEKKELLREMMPKMMEKMMEGMTAEDKQEMMGSMMSQMFGGEGGMPSMMMQMMRGMMGGEEEENPRMPVMETQEDFKPWEFCPCRKICEEGFKKKSDES